MRSRRFISGVGQFFDMMGSAIAISGAVRDRRPVSNADLERLGIDPVQFRQIKSR